MAKKKKFKTGRENSLSSWYNSWTGFSKFAFFLQNLWKCSRGFFAEIFCKVILCQYFLEELLSISLENRNLSILRKLLENLCSQLGTFRYKAGSISKVPYDIVYCEKNSRETISVAKCSTSCLV